MDYAGLHDGLLQTVLTASGSPFSPSQTTISMSRVPRFLISEQTRIQYFAKAHMFA